MTQTDKPNHVHVPRASRRARLFLFLSALSTACLAPLASAGAADAEALLKEGKKLVTEKKYDEACPKIAESYKLAPSPATLLDLALCHEKQGKLATAWGEMLDAETDARKAGRADIETRARANSKALEPKLPRVTVTVAANTPGIEIAIDGQKIDVGALGKGRPIDPGEHKIVASAPGRKPFETTLNLGKAERKTVVVPALAEDGSAAAATPDKAPDKPAGQDGAAAGQAGGTTNVNTDGGGGAAGDTKPKDKPEEPDDGKGPIHRAKRLVVDVGAFGGGQLFFGGGTVDALSSLTYEYRITYPLGGEAAEYKACDASACYATVDPAIGVPVGGQVFVGYALTEKMHLGGRFFGSYLVTGGYSLLVGPALSVRVNDRLWVGGTLVVGFGGQNATINGARGEVPSEWVDLNGGDEVELQLNRTIPAENETGFGFSFGASAEVSFALAEFGKGKSITTGSLVASAWPTFLKTWNGYAIALPIGVGYRFH
ncbi:hypothetical protein [Polyangium spumosum]|uniref:PEGA domain-containing protein n=1 Tax=Polyangium spumosum TaxID=889282 RepID=A0A6N7PTZ0_9BACT|nr:hypothetical protein [Polyangium spumosum]MRG95518.1 hypothetical protein [Polyangium spumosum]